MSNQVQIETSSNKTKPRKRLNLVVFFVGISVVILAVIFMLLSGSLNTKFCTQQDEIFQTISSEAKNWLNKLPSASDWQKYYTDYTHQLNPTPLDSFLIISVPNGNEYVVNGESLRDPQSAQILYIPVEHGTQKSSMGVRGYIYLISGKIPNYDSSHMEVREMGSNIYCYTFKE